MSKFKRSLAALIAAGTVILAGCSSDKSTSDGLAGPVGDTPALTGTLRVSPDTVRVEPGSPLQLVAVDSTPSGVLLPAFVSWSASGGAVDSTGLFHAPESSGGVQVSARSSSGAVQGATVVVESGLTQQIAYAVSTSFWLEITPGNVSLAPGQTTQFSAAIKTSDAQSYGILAVWSATGGTISASGMYTAPTTAGTYKVIVKRQGDAIADTATVTVVTGLSPTTPAKPVAPTPPPTTESTRSGFWIDVQPATVSVAKSGSQQFTAVGKSVNGKSYGVMVTWRATGGTISSSGKYTAPSTSGTYRVIATRQGDVQTDTAVVTVGSGSGTTTPPPSTPAPTLSSIVMTPATASVAAKATQQFSVAGKMSDGSTGSVSVTWSATGGTISTGGLYTAGATAGSYRVIAVQQGGTKADTSVVTVTAATSPTPPVVAQPELPRSVVNTAWALPAGGTTRTVNAGDNLQAAINAAVAGDVIVLQAGATFTGNFTLPAKSGSGTIYIMSGGSLPAAGTRVGPGNAGQLAKIVTGNDSPAFDISGARYRLVGLEVTTTFSGGEQYGLVNVTGSNVVLDRLYIHGTASGSVRRGVALNGSTEAVIDSYISDIHSNGSDSQAIAGWNGAGPFKLENNHLEAAAENVLFGGADPSTPNLVPSDIEILRNHMYKPLSWQGGPWVVKNNMELKNAQRLRIEGNVFENDWAAAQNGTMVLIMGVNQDGGAPWSIAQDITFRYNIIKNGPGGLRIIGQYDNTNPIGSRFLVAHNLFVVGQNTSLGELTHTIGVGAGPRDVTIENNTINGGLNVLALWGTKTNALSFRNNVAAMGQYGIWGDAIGLGTTALNAYATSWTATNNVLWGGSASGYPANNQYPGSLSAVGFVNAAGGDYHLSGSSAYLTAGTSGSRPGADIDQLLTRTQGVAQ